MKNLLLIHYMAKQNRKRMIREKLKDLVDALIEREKQKQ